MHLYLFVRGKFEQVELWKCHAQAAYWKWKRINQKTGEEQIKIVQGALRPSVMGAYEYVFPKEALAEVCSFFGILPPKSKNEKYSSFGWLTLNAVRMATLRKIFGCKKIPSDVLKKAEKIPATFTTEEFQRGVSTCVIPGVAIHAIGIKEDKMAVFPDGYLQEAL